MEKIYLEDFLDNLSKKLNSTSDKEECISLVENYKNNLTDNVVKNFFIKKSLNEFLDLLIKQINNEPVELASDEA